MQQTTSTLITELASNSENDENLNSLNEKQNDRVENLSNLSPISCICCRKAHKKCDRQLPTCSKCIQRGIACAYNEPKKRGKAAEAYQQRKKRKEQDLDELAANVIHYFYTFISGGHPVIRKPKFEYFVNHYLAQLENNNEFVLIPNDYISNIEELQCIYLFYLSIKSIYYQLNTELELASDSMKNCEELYSKLVTKSFMNFYFNAACQFISLYYSGIGDFVKVRFYIAIVKFYLSERKEFTDLYEKNLERKIVFQNKSSNDLIDGFSAFIENMPKIFEVTVGQNLENLLIPGALEYLRTASVTTENYCFFKQVVDFVFKVVGQYRVDLFKQMIDCHSETFFKFEKLHRNLIYYGFQLFFLSRLPAFSPQLEEVALKLSCLTEHEYFKYSVPEVIPCVSECAKIHLQVIRQIESRKRANNMPFITSNGKVLTIDYYSILERDYNALKSLEKRYPRVRNSFGSLINEIQTILNNHDNQGEMAPIEPNPILFNKQTIDDSSDFVSSPNSNILAEDLRWKSLLKYLEAIRERLGDDSGSSSGDSSFDFDQFFD
ncbi:predicted protein [Naegleria gruberi]|uniref:Predicted protein n=1 Tax=Naegleria gruberi TaxID=5762 RepID=D2W2M7_NAEGR|nr:uncharacterized protein NAEGRDRAFT_75644 [Naegleria gruberi]EFC36642.1 predicted protein [Naegleria gruberi]|eukprot:XP_002669386.1 predicted protein [Naegleria gruberi strain NEG-M]